MGFWKTVGDIGCAFDWISPLAGALGELSGEKGFAVADDSFVAAEATLKRAGINVHHPFYVSGQYVFNVDAGKGKEAEKVLRRAGLL